MGTSLQRFALALGVSRALLLPHTTAIVHLIDQCLASRSYKKDQPHSGSVGDRGHPGLDTPIGGYLVWERPWDTFSLPLPEPC